MSFTKFGGFFFAENQVSLCIPLFIEFFSHDFTSFHLKRKCV
nr:MAG TPA: hypothetical protein [Caudoviricetes sp.]